MKILVIYYSQTGRTKRVAKELTDILRSRGAEVKQARIEPEEERDYHTNIREARKGVAAKIKPTLTNVSAYDLVCMGTPVWSSSPAPSVNGYLVACSGLKESSPIFSVNFPQDKEIIFKDDFQKSLTQG